MDAGIRQVEQLRRDSAAELNRVADDQIGLPLPEQVDQVVGHLRGKPQDESPELPDTGMGHLFLNGLPFRKLFQDMPGSLTNPATREVPESSALDDGAKTFAGGECHLVVVIPESLRQRNHRVEVPKQGL